MSNYAIGQIPVFGLPINLCILSVILLFFACLVLEKPKLDKWMIMYFVFLFFYVISALASGFGNILFHKLYSTFFISFVVYWATGIMIRRFNTLSPLIYTLLFIGMLDVFVTVLQANGIPIHNPFITSIIQNTEQDEFLAAHGYELGFAISGIYANPVFNGHILLFIFLISLLPQYDKLNISMLIFTFALIVGLFFCQQRSAFIFSIVAFVFVFYRKIKASKFSFLLFFVFIIASIAVYNYFVDYVAVTGSRLSQTNDTGREIIWNNAINFIVGHPFFGGYDLFIMESGTYPHNLILSSFLAGGLFGGLILLVMVGNQIVYIIKKINVTKNFFYYILGIIYFAMLADSMLHNTGLVDMDFSTFIIWGMFSPIMRYNLSPNISFSKRKNI